MRTIAKISLGVILTTCVLMLILTGCSDKKRMHESKEKMDSGQVILKPQIEPTDRGDPAIVLTEDILFPGSEPFEGAVYDYLARETPAKVAHWFEIQIEDCTVKKVPTQSEVDEHWIIRSGDLIVEVHHGPNPESSLIRYKKDIYWENGETQTETE